MKTIGEFYYKKVLSLPEEETKTVHLPSSAGEIKIEPGLFEWRLYAGKRWIACRSQAEARYLQMFLDAGMTEVRVPLDDDYLASILPQLEQIKARIDEILAEYMEGLLSRKLREKLRRLVYAEVTQWDEFESGSERTDQEAPGGAAPRA